MSNYLSSKELEAVKALVDNANDTALRFGDVSVLMIVRDCNGDSLGTIHIVDDGHYVFTPGEFDIRAL